MIVFELECTAAGHRFEGWFGSSSDFSDQLDRGLVACPVCGTSDVIKAPMAPRLGRKSNQGAELAPKRDVAGGVVPPEVQQAMAELARAQTEALKQSRWVGDSFAEESRAIHYGEREAEAIHGQASLAEARDLLEEGIGVMPLVFPVAPPDQAN